MKYSPVILIILDGPGLNPGRSCNGWALARTPHLDRTFASWPHTVLQASGEAAGLPDGQFGNPEVGHLTLGAGRLLEQDLLRITEAIADGSLSNHLAWQALIHNTQRLHLVGMISDGGVHPHIDHLCGLLPLIVQAGVEPVIYMVTDGRDTAPRSALAYLPIIEKILQSLGKGCIAAVADRVIAAIDSDAYNFIVVNFANTDMVGHTAIQRAIIQAIETVDLHSGRVVDAALQRNWRVLLTADHGNCEEVVDPQTGEPHTQHTAYPVPLLLAGVPSVNPGSGRSLLLKPEPCGQS